MGEQGVSWMVEHGVPGMGKHGVSRMGEHGVLGQRENGAHGMSKHGVPEMGLKLGRRGDLITELMKRDMSVPILCLNKDSTSVTTATLASSSSYISIR